MKSKLIFRHIKNNILKYTVAFSAVVHLIGIFVFPSWGTAPDLVKERIIKIKTILKQPEKPVQRTLPEVKEIYKSASSQPMKQSETVIPEIREKTPRVRNAKAVEPSLVVKNIPSSIHFPEQNFQPMKANLKNSPTPHPSASRQKMAEIKFHPISPKRLHTPRAKNNLIASSTKLTERQASVSFLKTTAVNIQSPVSQINRTPKILSARHVQERKHFAQVVLVNRPQTRPTVTPNTKINFIRTKAKPIQAFVTARLNGNYSNPQPTRAIKGAIGNEVKKTVPLIHPQTMQHLERDNSSAPTRVKDFALLSDSAPALEVWERSPTNYASNTSNPVQRAIPIFAKSAPPSLKKTGLLQLASIPSGFIEETINKKTIKGNGDTIATPPSKQNIPAGGTNEISADQMGKIKLAFSSQIRSKIAQTKYYPRMARKRGFEGEPVVAFTLGNSGDLLEITITKPSKHELLDEAALDAVRSASPYPPIPELLKLKILRFELPITFK